MKPFNGGSAQMAAAATRKSAPVWGIRRSSPPSWSRSRVPVATWTDPAARKSAPLNSGVVDQQNEGGHQTQGRQSWGGRVATKSPEAPTARRTSPILSVVEYARVVFKSVLLAACSEPNSADSAAERSGRRATTTPVLRRAGRFRRGRSRRHRGRPSPRT